MSTSAIDPDLGRQFAYQIQVVQMGQAAKAYTDQLAATVDPTALQSAATTAQQASSIAQAAQAVAAGAIPRPATPSSTQVVVMNPDGSVGTRPLSQGGAATGSLDPSTITVIPPAV